MNQSEQINELAAALATASKSFQPILKDKTVKVRMKTGGEYTFSYAPLESIMAAVRPSLADNGLFLSQCVTHPADLDLVETKVIHASGQWMSNLIPVLIQGDGPQAYGSAVTYARRYGVTTLLCLVADDDDDGNAAEGNQATPVQRATSNGHGTDKAKFTKKVNEYSDRIKKAVDASNDALLREIQAEVRDGGEDFRIAVWASLPTAIQTYITSRFPKAA